MSATLDFSVYCADVGRVAPQPAKNKFAWTGWRASAAGREVLSGRYPEELAEAVTADLGRGTKVALGFECPLFVPLDADHYSITKGRAGEGRRPWSAGGGASALAAGLAEVTWILLRIKEQMIRKNWSAPPVYLEAEEFQTTSRGLLLWEAFLSEQPEEIADAQIAERAVYAFSSAWPNLDAGDPFAAEERPVFSVAGAAILRAGFSDDVGLLFRKGVAVKG
ncbi:MAG: hypothetical protein M5U26_09955 [Planctomycetota bacterium]|nr:hypothetical protein [Planctomycetota bacterium]